MPFGADDPTRFLPFLPTQTSARSSDPDSPRPKIFIIFPWHSLPLLLLRLGARLYAYATAQRAAWAGPVVALSGCRVFFEQYLPRVGLDPRVQVHSTALTAQHGDLSFVWVLVLRLELLLLLHIA